jgi:hypothetical protein
MRLSLAKDGGKNSLIHYANLFEVQINENVLSGVSQAQSELSEISDQRILRWWIILTEKAGKLRDSEKKRPTKDQESMKSDYINQLMNDTAKARENLDQSFASFMSNPAYRSYLQTEKTKWINFKERERLRWENHLASHVVCSFFMLSTVEEHKELCDKRSESTCERRTASKVRLNVKTGSR